VVDQTPRFDVEISLADEEGDVHVYKMPITFEALKRLNEFGISPTEVVLKGARYDFTEIQMIRTILVGVTEAGGQWTEEEIGLEMLRTGFLHYEMKIALYLSGFATGGIHINHKPKKKAGAVSGKKKGRSGRGSGTPTRSRRSAGASPRRSSGSSTSRNGGGSTTSKTPKSPGG